MPKPLQYGFIQYRDNMNAPVTAQLVPAINVAIRATLVEHQNQVNALLGLFSARTTKFKFRFKTGAEKFLQALDENGRARITNGGIEYDVALPIFAAGDAWGATYVQEQKLTIQDINDWMYDTLTADNRFLSFLILRALFAKDPWKYVDPEHGELTIRPLANGDDQPYVIRSGTASAEGDNHLLAQVDPISDAHNPFRMIRRELIEHPENGGTDAKIIVLTSTATADNIEEMTGFKEEGDPDIAQGVGNDRLVGRLNVPVPGTVRGKINQCWIVEWPTLPDTHSIAVPVGAGGAPALNQREHEQASLQGFFEMPETRDTPYHKREFQRHTGFAPVNRVGALVLQTGTNVYSTPPVYKAPVTD